MAKAKQHLIGTFVPDENENIFNDTYYGAVLVHDKYQFNDMKCFGVIEICGTDRDDRPSASSVMDELEDPPSSMTADGARKLAALLIKAADKADELNAGRQTFVHPDDPEYENV